MWWLPGAEPLLPNYAGVARSPSYLMMIRIRHRFTSRVNAVDRGVRHRQDFPDARGTGFKRAG